MKINILFVDNGTNTLSDYIQLLDRCDITVVKWDKLKFTNVNSYDLIILSDGSKINVNRNVDELNLIKEATTPIIGICYGFQILCYYYNLDIYKLPNMSEGMNNINVLTDHPMFSKIKTFKAIEKHRYGVKEINYLNDKVVCHAYSSDGIEIIEIKDKRQFGFQFHPEININGSYGGHILANLINWLF